MSEYDNQSIRDIVRGAYDLQKLRMSMGNRIVANFRGKLGQSPGKTEEELDKDAKIIIDDLRRRFKLLTDGVAAFPRQATFTGDGVISTYTELCLIKNYLDMHATEQDHFKRMDKILREYPIYTEFLETVKGVGPAMAGVIISEINIHKAKYPSSIWRYAGLDVGDDGRGRSRRKEHQIQVSYEDKNGVTQLKQSITFNPFLKTKLIGVLGPQFIRQKDSPYGKVYYDYKHRLDNRPDLAEATKARKHNMAIRYAVKIFLLDLYRHWRELEGLPVSVPYAEAKLGIKHSA